MQAASRFRKQEVVHEEAVALHGLGANPRRVGPKVGEALAYLAPRVGIPEEQVLTGLPHPSGASGERIAYFLGRKPRERLSSKTNAARLDAARMELMMKIEKLGV